MGITVSSEAITPTWSTMATKVTSKAPVTIPKLVRGHLDIGPGSEFSFRRAADGSIVIEKSNGTPASTPIFSSGLMPKSNSFGY